MHVIAHTCKQPPQAVISMAGYGLTGKRLQPARFRNLYGSLQLRETTAAYGGLRRRLRGLKWRRREYCTTAPATTILLLLLLGYRFTALWSDGVVYIMKSRGPRELALGNTTGGGIEWQEREGVSDTEGARWQVGLKPVENRAMDAEPRGETSE